MIIESARQSRMDHRAIFRLKYDLHNAERLARIRPNPENSRALIVKSATTVIVDRVPSRCTRPPTHRAIAPPPPPAYPPAETPRLGTWHRDPVGSGFVRFVRFVVNLAQNDSLLEDHHRRLAFPWRSDLVNKMVNSSLHCRLPSAMVLAESERPSLDVPIRRFQNKLRRIVPRLKPDPTVRFPCTILHYFGPGSKTTFFG